MTKNIILCFLLFLSALQAAFAQSTASPFDLLPRMPITPDSAAIAIATSSNPFDIIKIQTSRRPATGVSTGLVFERREKPVSAKDKESMYRRFLFITVITMMIILTLVVTVFRILIEKVWKAFLNDNLLNQLVREQSAGITLAYLILYFMFLINAGIFVFLVTRHFGASPSSSNVISLLICTGGLAGFFVLKHFLLAVVRYVFPVEKEMVAYNFTVIIFNIVLGFCLVPIVLLTAYAPKDVTEYAIYGAAGLLVLTWLFRNLRGLVIANRFIAWHKFHFLFYLCAVELAPLLVVMKLLLNQRDV